MSSATPADGRYDNIESASHALLRETVAVANAAAEPYVVIGGWSPVLLDGSDDFPHPGTRDVDLLFERGGEEGALGGVISAFLDSGYLATAKHEFQLARLLDVDGTQIVFNVDFLHPGETTQGRSGEWQMFVKHLDMTVRLAPSLEPLMRRASIGTPSARAIFNFDLITNVDIGEDQGDLLVAPIVNEIGLLITKAGSVLKPKRDRDALDIFLAARSATDDPALVGQATEMCKQDEDIRDLLHALRGRVEEKAVTFDELVMRYAAGHDEALVDSPSRTVARLLEVVVTS